MSTDVPGMSLPSGATMPRIGQGTWYLGEDPARRSGELAALRLGLDLGLSMVDTAEMYGDGAAELLVAQAIAGRRDDAFLVDKVLPANASRKGTIRACHRSLQRLGTDRIDLYLLHWRGTYPLWETVEAFTELVDAGDVVDWGVSNFDGSDLAELAAVPGGGAWATDQILYNPARRGPEYDLLAHCRRHGAPVMAYSPFDQGRLLRHPTIGEVAARHRATPAQVVLAWVLRREGVAVLARATDPAHVQGNAAAVDLRLTDADLATIDAAFPPPAGPTPLETI